MNGTVVATAEAIATYLVIDEVNEITRYDGGFSRGFLLNEQGASLMADYYGGNPFIRRRTGFLRRIYITNFRAITMTIP